MSGLIDLTTIDDVTWHRGSAADLPLPDESIPCIVTSPPYNVGIGYPGYEDRLPWSLYWHRVRAWASEMTRVLEPGGRLWVVVAPTVPLVPGKPGGERVALGAAWTTALMGARLRYRDEITWRQQPDGACAWGSFRQPSAPNVRGRHEVILCFYKPPYKREPPSLAFRRTGQRDAYTDPDFWPPKDPHWRDPDNLTEDGKRPSYDPEIHDVELGGPWTELVTNVWDLKQTTGKDRYPGSYPVELAARCIRLSTWPNEVVLDPFAGGGTTGEAARGLREQRRALLVDLP